MWITCFAYSLKYIQSHGTPVSLCASIYYQSCYYYPMMANVIRGENVYSVFLQSPCTFREVMGVQITVSSMCELLASLIHQSIFKAMEHLSHCAQVFTINLVTISPRWRTAFEVRMFTACFCNLPVNFAKLWASQLQLEVCVNYWIRASIEGSFFAEKSGYLIVGILIVMDLAGW